MPRKILFICTANIDRSPTAEDLLKNKKNFEVKSAGTWIHANKRITSELLQWADIIFVMEENHREEIITLEPKVADKIITLNIPDRFQRGDTYLIILLKQKLSKYLGVKW